MAVVICCIRIFEAPTQHISTLHEWGLGGVAKPLKLWKQPETTGPSLASLFVPRMGIRTLIQSESGKGVKKPSDPAANAMIGGIAPEKRPEVQHKVPSPPKEITKSMCSSSLSCLGVQVRQRCAKPGGSPSEVPHCHFGAKLISSRFTLLTSLRQSHGPAHQQTFRGEGSGFIPGLLPCTSSQSSGSSTT